MTELNRTIASERAKHAKTLPYYLYLPKFQPPSPGEFVYRLRCPVTKAIRYIGATHNPRARFWDHTRTTAHPTLKEWRSWLLEMGKFPLMEIVAGPMHRPLAVAIERALIVKTRRHFPGQLLNVYPRKKRS